MGTLFRFIFSWAFLIALGGPSSPAFAQSVSGLALSADSMSRNSEKGTVSLKGNVQVVFQTTYLSAGEATIDTKTREVRASGKVVLQNPKSYIEAERITLNYDTKKGMLEKAFVQSGAVIFEGDLIEKTGEDSYIVQKGNYTACRTCPAAWSFSGSRVEAEIGGYADIKYPILRIAGYPVFWLPRIILPLKSTRQTGLLEPKLEIGSASGVSIAQPYFWALSKSSDATITPKYYERRGWKSLAEYRYVLTEESYGQLNAAYLNDKVFKDNEEDVNRNIERGFASYKHYYELPEGYVQRAELKYVSDLRYTRDFSEEVEGHGDSALANNISLTKNFNNHQWTLETNLYRNLLQADPLANNRNAVHKVPQLHYSMMEQHLLDSNLRLSLEVDFVNFGREDLSFDDTETGVPCEFTRNGVIIKPDRCVKKTRDGEFDPSTDLIRAGQRFDFQPRLSYAFKIGKSVEVEPRMIYRETQYAFATPEVDNDIGYSPSTSRRYLQTDLALRTQMSRIYYMDLNDARATRYKHTLQPEIEYSAIPWMIRPEHPFFGDYKKETYAQTFEKVTDQDFFGDRRVQFDYYDRIFSKRIVNVSLVNRVLRKTWSGDAPNYESVATFKLTQGYDFDEFQQDTPRPLSTLNGLLNLKFAPIDSLTTVYYYPYANVADYSTRIRLTNSKGNFGEVSYTQAFILDEDNTRIPEYDNRTENLGLSVGHVGTYFSLIGSLSYSAVTYDVLSWEYIARIKPPGDCWGFDIGHKQDIASDDVKFKFNFTFQYGGI